MSKNSRFHKFCASDLKVLDFVTMAWLRPLSLVTGWLGVSAVAHLIHPRAQNASGPSVEVHINFGPRVSDSYS